MVLMFLIIYIFFSKVIIILIILSKFIELYILELYNLPLSPYFSLIKCSMKL